MTWAVQDIWAVGITGPYIYVRGIVFIPVDVKEQEKKSSPEGALKRESGMDCVKTFFNGFFDKAV